MNPALRQQAHELRKQAAHLLERAEALLNELREITDFTPAPPVQENSNHNGRRTIHVVR